MARSDNRYPLHPGTKKVSPDTARHAARAFRPGARTRRVMSFDHVAAQKEYGATSDGLALTYGWLIHSSRPRLSELRRLGLVVDSGNRREGGSGPLQAVWVLTRYAVGVRPDAQGDLFTQLEAGA